VNVTGGISRENTAYEASLRQGNPGQGITRRWPQSSRLFPPDPGMQREDEYNWFSIASGPDIVP
jgi:hypothetical protein